MVLLIFDTYLSGEKMHSFLHSDYFICLEGFIFLFPDGIDPVFKLMI